MISLNFDLFYRTDTLESQKYVIILFASFDIGTLQNSCRNIVHITTLAHQSICK